MEAARWRDRSGSLKVSEQILDRLLIFVQAVDDPLAGSVKEPIARPSATSVIVGCRASGFAPKHGEGDAVGANEVPGSVEVADIADAYNDEAVVVVSSELLKSRSVTLAEASKRGPEPKQQRFLAVRERAQVDRRAGGHIDHVEVEKVL